MTSAILPLSVAAIALNRFGLGARPDEPPPSRPASWLSAQFDRFEVRPAGFAALDDPAGPFQREQQQRRAAGAPEARIASRKAFREAAYALYRAGVQARADSALATEAPFVERLVHFWSNHLCVSADNPRVAAFTPSFERDAIRPHVLGRFADMLLAAEQHPAMLMYLNQAGSIGPDSPAALAGLQRDPQRRRGLNENLGREAMELHTLGVGSGYTQADVTEFARALTGWTVDGAGRRRFAQGDPDRFLFRPALHEPGVRRILQVDYPQPGEAQAQAALEDFAAAPQTATHIATKLARHFAGDAPPPALVDRLARSFVRSRGDLPALYRTLIESPEPWAPVPLKFKSPWEWTVSALRALGTREAGDLQVAPTLRQLGQPVWQPGSPAGWDDTAARWAGPDALMRRVDLASRLAAPVGDRLDARSLGARVLPGALRPATAQELARAESPTASLALLLVSPDFLRR